MQLGGKKFNVVLAAAIQLIRQTETCHTQKEARYNHTPSTRTQFACLHCEDFVLCFPCTQM